MQSSIKNDLVYLLRILESIGKISLYSESYSEPMSFFEANEQQPFNASLSLLMNIGEQSTKLSEELRLKYIDVAWNEIRTYRNRAAHDYTGIDKVITFQIIKEHLPKLNNAVILIIKEQLAKSVFDKEELLAAQGNSYYRHIDFTTFIS